MRGASRRPEATSGPAVAAAPGARISAGDAVVALHALRLSRLAQRAGAEPSLPELIARLASVRGLPRRLAPDAAHRATVRACARGARWLRFRDTCLVRSLVAGALLSDHDEVLLHVGFASGSAQGRALEGHAWVSVAGTVVGGPEAAMDPGRPTTEMSIPVRRRRRAAPDPAAG